MAPYLFNVQRDIVIACAAIHNYIRKTAITDSLFEQYQVEDDILHNNQHNASASETPDSGARNIADQTYMIHLREQIANQLFT